MITYKLLSFLSFWDYLFWTTWQLGEANADKPFLDEVKLRHFLVFVINHSVFIFGKEYSRVESVRKWIQQLGVSVFLKVDLAKESREVSEDVIEKVIRNQALLNWLRQQQLIEAGVMKALHSIICPIIRKMCFYLFLQYFFNRLPVFISLNFNKK